MWFYLYIRYMHTAYDCICISLYTEINREWMAFVKKWGGQKLGLDKWRLHSHLHSWLTMAKDACNILSCLKYYSLIYVVISSTANTWNPSTQLFELAVAGQLKRMQRPLQRRIQRLRWRLYRICLVPKLWTERGIVQNIKTYSVTDSHGR